VLAKESGWLGANPVPRKYYDCARMKAARDAKPVRQKAITKEQKRMKRRNYLDDV
jgi:hypothetical protein